MSFKDDLERYTRSPWIKTSLWKIEEPKDSSSLRYNKKRGLNERKYLEMTANRKG